MDLKKAEREVSLAQDEVDELQKQSEEQNDLITKMELSLDERDLRIADQQRIA